MRVGILALQGDFTKHAAHFSAHGASTMLIKKPNELRAVDALVLPGGESTTLLKLLTSDFRKTLTDVISSGLPTFATCAGLILLARAVENPAQDSLALLDVTVTRNAYGSQRDSFISNKLVWNAGTRAAQEGVFIRAPQISSTGAGVMTVLSLDDAPVCVRHGSILAAAFHPELSPGKSPLLGYFFDEMISI